jgi:hypothetical protein
MKERKPNDAGREHSALPGESSADYAYAACRTVVEQPFPAWAPLPLRY